MHFPGKRRSLPRMTLPRKWPNLFSLKGCQVDSENWKTEMYTKAMFVADHITADIMDAYGCLIFSPIYPEASFESKVWEFSRNLHILNANAKHGPHGRWALPHRLGITLWTNQVNTAETLCTCCYPCPYQVLCKMRLASSEMLVLHRKTIHMKQRQETPWVDL